MCEVLPSIDETASPSPDGENSKLEQLMISMLEERDRLMDKLRETQDSYNEAMKKLSQVEADNDVLMRQLQAVMPEVRALVIRGSEGAGFYFQNKQVRVSKSESAKKCYGTEVWRTCTHCTAVRSLVSKVVFGTEVMSV